MNSKPTMAGSSPRESLDADPPDCGQLYTPAMLANILGVSVRLVRRWHRAGLLRSTTEVMQLPYFDFSQLATTRRLVRWMEQGATVQSILRQLQLLRDRASESVPAELLTIDNLPITAEGKRLILRSGDQLLEASGQLRFGFELAADSSAFVEQPATLPFRTSASPAARSSPAIKSSVSAARLESGDVLSFDAMIDQALIAEDSDDLPTAIDWYRAALAAHGSSADVCFQLAELLYRDGDLCGARERYFMALELEPGLVEARANLGCVLAECGQLELAIAAFEGVLAQFADYADVHFHLARALDDLGHTTRAAEHWRKFLELAPASPWAEEAEHRISQLSPLLDF